VYYGLVHYLSIDTEHIDRFRSKHDPHVDLIEPHITVVFPVPGFIGKERIVRHIQSVLRGWKSFPIHLQGFHKSWNHWLFLILQEGNASVIRLHDELYTGVLAGYRKEDIGFIPHLGLGFFAKRDAAYDILDPQQVPLDTARYSQALEEAKRLNLDYHGVIDKLHLVEITDDVSQIERDKEFVLPT
jgi:2'-5' RNA ligase